MAIPDGGSKGDRTKLFSVVLKQDKEAKAANENTVGRHLLWLLTPSSAAVGALTLEESLPNSHPCFSPRHFPAVRDKDEDVPVLLA